MRFDIQQKTIHFDILIISETCLQSNVTNRFINIDGYSLIRNDRPTDIGLPQSHGGVAIMYRNDFICHRLTTDTDSPGKRTSIEPRITLD